MVPFFATSGYSSLVEWDKKWKINKSSRSLWCAQSSPAKSSLPAPQTNHSVVSGNVFWQKMREKRWGWLHKLVLLLLPYALHCSAMFYIKKYTLCNIPELFAYLYPIQKSILYSNIPWIPGYYISRYQLSHRYTPLGGSMLGSGLSRWQCCSVS